MNTLLFRENFHLGRRSILKSSPPEFRRLRLSSCSKIRARSTGHQAFDCAAGYLESNYQDWEDEWDKGHDSQLFEGMTFGSNVMFPWFSRNLVGGKKLISETGECEDLLESKFVLDRGYKAGVEDCEDRFLCAEDLRLRTRICRGIWRRMTGRCD